MTKTTENTNPSLLGDPNMLLPVEVLDLSTRSLNSLKHSSQAHYIGDLIASSLGFIAKSRNLGKKSLMEIVTKLANKGYKIGEGNDLGLMQTGDVNHLRQTYRIPHEVEVPTDWVRIEGRMPIKADFNHTGKILTNRFSGTIRVALPYKVADGETLKAVEKMCQKAFVLAVNHEVDVARDPENKETLEQALRVHLPFDAAASYKPCDYALCSVNLSEALTFVSNHAFLVRVTKSLGGESLKGFVAPALALKV